MKKNNSNNSNFKTPSQRRSAVVARIQSGERVERRHHHHDTTKPNYVARRAAALLLAAGSIGAGGKVINAVHHDSGKESPTPTTEVIVEPGDTLWNLQKRELIESGWDPDEVDMRDVVSDSIDLNVDLNGSAHIEPGQRVLLVDFENRPGSLQEIAKQTELPKNP
jgi:hypothetical protein